MQPCYNHACSSHRHERRAGPSQARSMPRTLPAIDGRRKGTYNRTADTVSANGSNPNILGGHREGTSSLIAKPFSFHSKIYISTFLP